MPRSVNVARPSGPVVWVVVPISCPAPLATAAVTVTPREGTGFPAASCTSTTGCWSNGTPTCALPDGWVASARAEGAPAVAVASNRTDPAPGADASTRWVPMLGPSVQAVDVWPSAPVVADAGETEPSPDTTVQVTATPLTGFSASSSTWITSGEARLAPAWPVWPSPETARISLAV